MSSTNAKNDTDNFKKVEDGIEIIDNLLMKGRDINKAVYFKEDNTKDLKAAFRCCNLPTSIINTQLNRLELRRCFTDDVYVLYGKTIKRLNIKNRELQKQLDKLLKGQDTCFQAVQKIRDFLRQSNYLIYQDSTGKYHLYDIVTEKPLSNFSDFEKSILLVSSLKEYRQQLENYLANNQ